MTAGWGKSYRRLGAVETWSSPLLGEGPATIVPFGWQRDADTPPGSARLNWGLHGEATSLTLPFGVPGELAYVEAEQGPCVKLTLRGEPRDDGPSELSIVLPFHLLRALVGSAKRAGGTP